MSYLLSALMGLILIASWALIMLVIAAMHHQGMSRVRRAETRWKSDLARARDRHPAGRAL